MRYLARMKASSSDRLKLFGFLSICIASFMQMYSSRHFLYSSFSSSIALSKIKVDSLDYLLGKSNSFRAYSTEIFKPKKRYLKVSAISTISPFCIFLDLTPLSECLLSAVSCCLCCFT